MLGLRRREVRNGGNRDRRRFSFALRDKLLSPSSSPLFSHGLLSTRRLALVPPMRQARPSLRVAVAGRRMTLSEGWDMSGSTPGAFRMSRFEELDSTNVVLRQRIVFLRSQVDTMTAD